MNEPRRRGPIASVLFGLWDAMNFTRRLILNIAFFGLLLLFIAALGAGRSFRWRAAVPW
jgi:protease-4